MNTGKLPVLLLGGLFGLAILRLLLLVLLLAVFFGNLGALFCEFFVLFLDFVLAFAGLSAAAGTRLQKSACLLF